MLIDFNIVKSVPASLLHCLCLPILALMAAVKSQC